MTVRDECCTGCWRRCRYVRFRFLPRMSRAERFSLFLSSMWSESDDPADWSYKTRGAVLGRMHEEKKKAWLYFTSTCPLAKERGPSMEDRTRFNYRRIYNVVRGSFAGRGAVYSTGRVAVHDLDGPSNTSVRIEEVRRSGRGRVYAAWLTTGYPEEGSFRRWCVVAAHLQNDICLKISKLLTGHWSSLRKNGIAF